MVTVRKRGIMKKICNYAFRIVCVYIVVLTLFSLASANVTIEKESYLVQNSNITKQLNSKLIANGVVEQEEIKEELEIPQAKVEEKEEVIQQETTPVIEKQEPVVEQPQTSAPSYIAPIDTTSFPVLSTNVGTVSHYGHDCYGCTSGKTASGYYIGDGRIYYNDPVFGSVRIVAAGSEYPLGSILRLTNIGDAPMLVIVLDRGGAIGSGKGRILDLLTESNAAAYQQGLKYNVKVEALRLGGQLKR